MTAISKIELPVATSTNQAAAASNPEMQEPVRCTEEPGRPQEAEKRGGTSRRKGPRITEKKVEEVRRKIGDYNLEELKNMTKNEERRPILAIVAENYSRPVVQEATGVKISEKEFTKTGIHGR